MNDVIIIGASMSGVALASDLIARDLQVVVVDAAAPKPPDWAGEWLEGIGVVNGPELVGILDPVSGDERRLIQGRTIVISTGPYDPAKPPARMLGITKLGAQFSEDGQRIRVNSSGQTRAKGIYATGNCATDNTPDLIDDLLQYCKPSSSTS